MNAILYAAGRAHRLGKLGEERPKILIEIGGKSLMERHVEILAQCRVPKLYVVTGYMRERFQPVFRDLQSRHGVEIVELFNADFTEGSALSMHASLPVLEQVEKDILLMDGDVLYDARMLERLVHSPHRTALLVDRGFATTDDDPVLVPMRDGKPFDFVKKWSGTADNVGESIGFFKVSAADLPLVISETKARSVGPGRSDSYDAILQALVKAGRFGAEDVTGLPWTEIDFPEDLEYASRVVLPALKQAG